MKLMPRLFLVDSFNFIFRAFHARQRMNAPPMRTSRGSSTEAIYIFHNMLRRLVKQYQPDYLAAVYESEGPTFRDEAFADYKATRTETPPELIEQLPAIERMLGAMRIPVLKLKGYEADDIIGTVAWKTASPDLEVWVISSDKDMLQLVNDHVRMLDAMKNDTLYDPAKVKEYKGVTPEQIPDLLALVGDTVDNIPGAPGIGDKGAVQLLEQFGSLPALLDRAPEVTRKAYRESLLNNRDQILFSRKLATIETAAPFEFHLDDLAIQGPDVPSLAEFYREYEFYSFLKELNVDAPPAVAEEPAEVIDSRIVFDYKAHLSAGNPPLDPPVEDLLLYSFLVLADPSACQLEPLVMRYLERPGATQAETLQLLAARLRPLVTPELKKLYDELDLPLAPVLARMERTGIRIATEQLASLSSRMEGEIGHLTEEIFALAGKPFNLNSPKQLGEILFEDMKLPTQGKTGKTKAYSTAADVLETLALEYPIAQKILEYRQLAKLKGTYVDALPMLLSPADQRLHTTFNPAGAATGRLSSSNPNLQNIPVRTELGREIRAAFVPDPGWTMLVADYSQIELRLLAHYSGDTLLMDSFRRNEDVHTRTASEVFGVPQLMVTPEMRRNAKAVNFGIVYGQTAFGLASQLGIARDEADRYIRNYFEMYAGVKKWIEATIAEVRQRGYTLTLDGRRRPIPDIAAKNPNARSFAERTAVNTPLQGTAADLIKLAMIRVDTELTRRKLQTRMLLQVHDELVLECPPDELEEATKLVKSTMESVVKLKVPLLVETGHGANWRDAK
ncbi:MAG: DNA polymerase I [Acidobacteria bacterium]|nr:DNA polymerase I [Acidobacteriota bacterium]